jgi:hypothetical protein
VGQVKNVAFLPKGRIQSAGLNGGDEQLCIGTGKTVHDPTAMSAIKLGWQIIDQQHAGTVAMDPVKLSLRQHEGDDQQFLLSP